MGANLLLNGSLGLVMPYPISRENFRTMAFLDAGNVFVRGTPEDLSGNNSGPIRLAAGISWEWRSPFGPLAFNVAFPINKQPYDLTQIFQFSVSSGF